MAYSPPFMKAPIFIIVDRIIDITFIIDIFVSFRTTFLDIHTGEEIVDWKIIGIRYLKSRFSIDALSTVPFDLIAIVIISDDNT